MISQTISKLSEQYNLLGDPIDLSCYYQTDGENIVYNLLKSMYRPVFDNKQRILIVQPKNDCYSYTPNIASDSLIFLQKCLQQVDISNFFVLVITGNQNIKQELEWLQKTYSTDQNPIQYCLIDEEFNKITTTSDTFCVNMWNHLHVSTQLDVLPCCVADSNAPLGNLNSNTLEEIVNSEHANSIRLKMLSNQRCSECSNCYIQEDQGLASRRIKNNYEYKHQIPQLKSLTNTDGSLISFKPQTIDIRLNNICNLKCRTCSGSFSSMIAIEEKNLFGNEINYLKTPKLDNREQVLDSIINYFDCAENIYFAGGEPIIMKEHYTILDHLIAIGRTDVPIIYNTNFTKLVYKEKNVLDYWKNFSIIKVNASIDGHGAAFEYVRHGAKWNQIEKNLILLKQHCPHVQFNVTSTISLISVESVMELQRQWHETGTLDIKHFQINPMYGDYLSLQTLLPEYKKNIAQKIHNHCQWLTNIGANNLVQAWNDIEKYMLSCDKTYINIEFSKGNRARDLARNENFESTYPQFSKLFKPYY